MTLQSLTNAQRSKRAGLILQIAAGMVLFLALLLAPAWARYLLGAAFVGYLLAGPLFSRWGLDDEIRGVAYATAGGAAFFAGRWMLGLAAAAILAALIGNLLRKRADRFFRDF